MDRAVVWAVRLGWVALPFTLGPALEEGLTTQPRAAQLAASIVLWAVWAAGAVATLVPHPVCLTAIRVAGWAALAAAVASIGAVGDGAGLAIGSAAAVAVLATSAAIGAFHVNGPAYRGETRFALRPPGAVLLGPLPFAWGLAVVVPAAGLLLAADGRLVGIAVVTAGAVGAPFALRSLHRLSRRWLVFVPVGVVLHDHLALFDPILIRRSSVTAFGQMCDAVAKIDLTLGAPGVGLQVTLAEPEDIGRPRRGRGVGDPVVAGAVVIAPTRPGAVLAEAARRKFAL